MLATQTCFLACAAVLVLRKRRQIEDGIHKLETAWDAWSCVLLYISLPQSLSLCLSLPISLSCRSLRNHGFEDSAVLIEVFPGYDGGHKTKAETQLHMIQVLQHRRLLGINLKRTEDCAEEISRGQGFAEACA